MLQALEVANPEQKELIYLLMRTNPTDKVEQMLSIFRECKVDKWANQLKEEYLAKAYKSLDEIAVISSRKKELTRLAANLIKRES